MGCETMLQRLHTTYNLQEGYLQLFSARTPRKNPDTLDRNPAPKHRALAGHHTTLWASKIDKPQKLRESVRGFLHLYTVLNNKNRDACPFAVTLLKEITTISVNNY